MAEQLLHLVFGGKVKDPQDIEFVDLDAVEMVGIFPNYQTAHDAWRGRSQASIDDAYTKFVIVHLHRLLEPEAEKE